MNFIKILNPDKAKELAGYDFKYTTESFEGKILYVFPNDNRIIRYIQNNFSSKDFFIDKTMNF